MQPRIKVVCVTPFTGDGEVDEGALRTIVAHHAGFGFGIYIGSFGSGEGHLLSAAEVRRTYEIAVDAAAGQAPVYAAALGFTDTARVIDLAHEAADAGVDAVQLQPPRPGPPTAPPRMLELERYYEDILGAVKSPIHLSNEWFMVGYTVPAELLAAAAADNAHVTSINTSDPDLSVVAELLERIDGVGRAVPVHVGLLPQLPTALVLGATGPLGFEATIAPELCVGMLDAFADGRLADFSAAFRKVLALHRGLMRYRNPRSVKAALAGMGLPAGAMRRPYLPLAPEETAEIEQLLRALELVDD
jgi:4-hydroxy-tetrahydrodipicolinate synthase